MFDPQKPDSAAKLFGYRLAITISITKSVAITAACGRLMGWW